MQEDATTPTPTPRSLPRSLSLRETPTTVRLGGLALQRLDALSKRSQLNRGALIRLAVEGLLDYEQRTGKLLIPKNSSAA